MTDERLVEIRAWVTDHETYDRQLSEIAGVPYPQSCTVNGVELPTLGELLAVIDEYREVIDLHHTDFKRLKTIITRCLASYRDAQTIFVMINELDGIVR